MEMYGEPQTRADILPPLLSPDECLTLGEWNSTVWPTYRKSKLFKMNALHHIEVFLNIAP